MSAKRDKESQEGSSDMKEDVGEAHAEDLALARAAAAGDARAIAVIEALHVRQIPAFVARHKLGPAEVDELSQRVRERLFVARDGKAPKIADYAGRGPLGAWLRVLVLRMATTDRRRARRDEPLDDATTEALVEQSPEHLLARARWQGAFDEALREAFGALSTEERALFRFQFGAGMTLDQIARVMGLHRATAARKIAAAREALWTTLTRLLRERLKLGAKELQALLGEWRSKLDVSLSGLLRETAD